MPEISFAPLSDRERRAPQAVPKASDPWQPLLPPPPDAPAPSFIHPKLGEPAVVWTYRDGEGQTLGYSCRFNPKGGGRKETRPLVFCQGPKGRRAWRWQGFPEPRPLYGLDRLAARSEAPVLVVEGEKAADAAGRLFPGLVAVTSPGGANAPAKADWRWLAGRAVCIWPDADGAGARYAQAVAGLVTQVGADSVWVVSLPEGFPEGWDLADPPPEGWDLQRLRSLLDAAPPWAEPPASPDAASSAQLSNWPFHLDEKGLWFRAEDADGDPDWQWVCSPLEVMARTRDARGEDWGRLLLVKDADGVWHEWAMPMSLTAGYGIDYRAQLKSYGLDLAPTRKARERLELYLVTAKPKGRARCVDRTGWSGGKAFILPDASFGDTCGEMVVFQGAARRDHAFRTQGTLEQWQKQVARLCQGNSRLAFAVSAAFAAPLLRLVGMEGGGFHFRGESSRGKTTTLLVAGSVWGGGETNGFVRSWRATSNGLEAVGLAHNDCLLCLDEMSLVDSRDVGEVADMLANGAGKTRARQDGSGTPALQWLLLFLSTGEVSLADKMAEVGRRARAGQEVRLADIPADAGAGLGIFETLHGFTSAAALADHLRLAAGRYYGTACRAYLERITAKLDGLTEAVREWVQAFLDQHCPKEADGQVKRAAGRFGLVAAAGELAITLGVLPWPAGEAMAAAGACFRAWLEQRGGTGALELLRGVEEVRHFFQAYAESRFALIGDKSHGLTISNRAGFKRRVGPEGDEGWEFLVFPKAFKEEVCAGFDSKALARELVRLRLMEAGTDGKMSRLVKLPNMKKARFYVFTPAVLGEEDGHV